MRIVAHLAAIAGSIVLSSAASAAHGGIREVELDVVAAVAAEHVAELRPPFVAEFFAVLLQRGAERAVYQREHLRRVRQRVVMRTTPSASSARATAALSDAAGASMVVIVLSGSRAPCEVSDASIRV